MQFTIRRQISVSLENAPGALSRAAGVLAREGVNIEGLSILDTLEQAVVRLLVSDPPLAAAALKRAGLNVIEADVVELMLPNLPGQLARLCAALAAAGVNVDYAYTTTGGERPVPALVVKASPLASATAVLTSLAAG